jgi:hypothetical protein
VCLRIVFLEPQRLLIVDNRLVDAALRMLRDTKIIERLREVGLEPNGFRELPDRLL